MWNSLRLRLILMFMLVVMMAVGTVAFFASRAATNGLYVYTQEEDNQQAVSALLTAYQHHQNQKALQTLTEQLARSLHQRIILFNHQRIITDSDRKLIGQVMTQAMFPTPPGAIVSTGISGSTTFSIGNASSINSAGVYLSSPDSQISISAGSPPPPSNKGVFAFTMSPFTKDSPEATFLASVNQSLWLAILIAGFTALLLALLFANTLLKPLHTLKVVADRMKQGDLNQRASIKAKGEIGALAHAFNAMADSLSRSEQLRRNLVSDVAHELRNPLMNIRGYLELFQDQVLEPTPETIASLYEETSLLSRLVADLQDLSLAEAGQLRLARQPISVEEVANQAVQIVQPHLARKNLALHVHIPSDLPPVEADQARIAQVLRNLLSNAITHTSSYGEISLIASVSETFVTISVQDTGSGIAPEHLPNLFERFYRADASRTRATGGTGLGLAIVKQIVQAHGGQVTVESQQGKGSCFLFTLPVASSTSLQQDISSAVLLPL